MLLHSVEDQYVSTTCLLLVPDKVSWEYENNFPETLEQCGRIILCLLNLRIKNYTRTVFVLYFIFLVINTVFYKWIGPWWIRGKKPQGSCLLPQTPWEALPEPGNHILSQVIKVDIISGKSYWWYVPLIWLEEKGALALSAALQASDNFYMF